jgi:DNA-binding transcriptional MerR regulator
MAERKTTLENNSVERVWDSNEVAKFLHISIKTLESWRQNGLGPPFVRYSRRCVRYRPEQIEKWILSRETAVN